MIARVQGQKSPGWTYIGHVERGEVNIALFNIVRIADALEIDPGELVQGLTSTT